MARCAWCGSENKADGSFCLKCGKPLEAAVVLGKCPQCGVLNALDMTRCGECGAPLPEIKPEMLPKPVPRKSCKWCGNKTELGEDECYECAHRRVDTTLASLPEKRASGTLAIGAVLLVVAGMLALVQGVIYLVAESALAAMEVSSYGNFGCCGLLDIVFGLGALAGGYFTFKRSTFALALIGAIVGMLGLGFMIGGLLGFVALLIIATSKNEFD